MYIHFIWFTPFQLIIITFFLYQELGPTSLIATVVVILQVPVQIGLANLYSAFWYVIIIITLQITKLLSGIA